MNFKHAFLFFALFLFPFVGCKKDAPFDEVKQATSFIERPKTALQELFFTIGHVEPQIEFVSEQVTDRSEEDLEPIFQAILDYDEIHNFIPGLVNDLGFALWTRVMEFSLDGYEPSIFFIPLAFADSERTNGFIVVHEAYDGTITFDIVDRSFINTFIGNEDISPAEEYFNLASSILAISIIDDQVFFNPDAAYLDWIRGNMDRFHQDTSNAAIRVRDNIITYCYAVSNSGYTSPTTGWTYNGNEFYSGEGATIVCIDIVVCPYIGANGSDPAGGGFSGWSNSGGNGGGGSNGMPTNSALVNQIIAECENILGADTSNGQAGDNVTGGNTPPSEGEVADCNDFFTVMENSQLNGNYLSANDLLWLWQNKKVLRMLAFEINGLGTGGVPPINIIKTYIQMVQNNETDLAWKGFKLLYEKVYNDLVPTLGLDPAVDGPFLMANENVTGLLKAFIDNHPNDELAVEYSTHAYNEIFTNPSDWNNENITNLFGRFDALSDYLESLTEQVVPIQNGITIMETYLHPTQQVPSSATALGGSAKNPIGGPDLISHTDRDYGFLDFICQTDVHVPEKVQEGIMKVLLYTATGVNGMQPIAGSYMNQFKSNPTDGSKYYSQSLSSLVMNSVKMRNWLKLYGKRLNDELAANNGNINNVSPFAIQERPTMNENDGLGILINDTQQTFMHLLDSWEFDSTTGEWNGRFIVNVTDNFGLDDDDARDYQYVPGFVAWWALQHRRGWHPFITDIWFVVRLSGKI